MLEARGLKKSFGDTAILDGVGLEIRPRDRVALVGRNGAGKSTLLRAMAGLVDLDAGSVQLNSGLSVAYLPQDGVIGSGSPLHDEMLGVFKSVWQLEARQRDLEMAMAGRDHSDPMLAELIEEHAELHAEFERFDGYTIEARIGSVLAGLGFGQDDYARRVDQLSGGWQMRAALAKVLLTGADILLLDEPTNHLDLQAVEWLEEYLQKYRGAVVIISHDRYLLDRVSTRTIEIENGSVVEYAGNYTCYSKERERQRAAQLAAYERQQEYLAEQMAFVERFRANARRASQARSREKMLAKQEVIEAPSSAPRMAFKLLPCPPSGREVVALKGVSKSYDGTSVLSECNALIEQGDRIGLVGPNGAGKSTLLRLLAREERPDHGNITRGEGVRVAYYAQHQAEALDPAKNVVQEVYGASRAGATLGEIRSLLGRLLFRQDDVFKSIAVLSGGERSRVALAKMLLRPSNLLLMDEPTNHLDISAREVVEVALREYQGTMVVASHDRFFLDRVATKILEVQDGRLELYLGNYSFYRQRKLAQAAATALDSGRTARAPFGTSQSTCEQPKRARVSERDVASVEQEVAAVEQRVTELAELLGQPEQYAGGQSPSELVAEYEAATRKLEELHRRWEELVEAL